MTNEQAQQIWVDMLSGKLDFETARTLLTQAKGKTIADSVVAAAMETRQAGLASGAKWAQTPAQPMGTLTPAGKAGNITLEGSTDPFTAYLSRLGIGGNMNRNPAEAYQADMFNPLFDTYQTQQRLTSPGGPLQNPSNSSTTFSDFLNKMGGGLGGLVNSSSGLLRDIFQSPQNVQASANLGYEPGQPMPGSSGEFSGQLDKGNLSELQNLFTYGLRPTQGSLGSKYAARRLPEAQQAYYSQKATNTPGTGISFLDWLKNNWQLQGY